MPWCEAKLKYENAYLKEIEKNTYWITEMNEVRKFSETEWQIFTST